MTILVCGVLARRYAQAYINLFGDQISIDTLNNFSKVAEFFELHKHLGAVFSFSFVSDNKKESLIKKLCKIFSLPRSCLFLMKILVEHKRMKLAKNVFRELVCLYNQRFGHMTFAVTSSISPTISQKKTIEAFLSKESKNVVRCIYTCNSDLIAGIRIQSDTLLWEHSVKRSLQDMIIALEREGVYGH